MRVDAIAATNSAAYQLATASLDQSPELWTIPVARLLRPNLDRGVTNSSCERWRLLGFLAVEPRCERLTLLIVRKLNGNVDCISLLITNEPGRLIPMAIEPFAHRRHLVSKIRGAHPNSNSTHSHPLPVDAPGDRYVPNVFKSLELKLNPDQSQPRKPLSGNG